ncbi:MAG TPA: hypothetical protein VIK01_06780 [Polyangiaceae bacterium]
MIRPIELAAKALSDPKTARRWLCPSERSTMKPVTAERLRRAAVELGWHESDDEKSPNRSASRRTSTQPTANRRVAP